jgi:hypothetical protein
MGQALTFVATVGNSKASEFADSAGTHLHHARRQILAANSQSLFDAHSADQKHYVRLLRIQLNQTCLEVGCQAHFVDENPAHECHQVQRDQRPHKQSEYKIEDPSDLNAVNF